MKKWTKILTLALSVLAMGACETEMIDYEGKTGVYFHVQKEPSSKFGDMETWERVDTSVLSFVTTQEDEMEVILPVRLMGDVVNYDRYFEVKLVDTATTAKVDMDYTPITLRNVIPADSIQGYVKFKLKRTEILLDTTYKIVLDLVPTNDFTLPMNKWRKLDSDYSEDRLINIVRHVIKFDDKLYRPSSWVPATLYDNRYWGPYTRKKMRLMLDVCGMIMSDFDEYLIGSQKIVIGTKVNQYLKAEEAAGRTIYEDEIFDKNGKPEKMRMGANII